MAGSIRRARGFVVAPGSSPGPARRGVAGAGVPSRHLLAILALLAVGPVAFAFDPPKVAYAFLDSVAGRMGLSLMSCPSSMRALFASSVRIVCYRHPYRSVGAFASAWASSAVWPGRFRAVSAWAGDGQGGTGVALYALDDVGFSLVLVPGPEGSVAVGLDALVAASRAFPPELALPARTPYEAMVRLGAQDASQVMTEEAMEYAYGERACARGDGACMVRLPARRSADVFRDLGMRATHWRVGDLPAGHYYSAWVDDLVLVVSESVRGVSVTAARADVVERAGAPIADAP